MQIQRGFRDKLNKYVDDNKNFDIRVTASGRSEYDFCCFGVDSADKLSDDRYMVFYNQLSSPNGEIKLSQSGGASTFSMNLSKLPPSVNKLVFTVNIDGSGVMSELSSLKIDIGGALTMDLSGKDFRNEKAIIALELYIKGEWRIACVASGFDGGLSALLKHYGGEEEISAPAPSKVSLEKKLGQSAPKLVSLAKPIKVVLDKKKLNDLIAKVGLVMDISGSMSGRYQNGTVQEVVNKIVPLAVQFDDDGDLDLWYYGSRPMRMDAVTMGNYESAVPHNWNKLMAKLGFGNHEPAVMRLVIDEYKKSKLPAYIVFVTDGGVGSAKDIKKLLIESSRYPIFWQFVGIGGSGYGVLEELDSMSGRVVDNANFFALDDFRTVSNETLYERLLNEFPQWLREAKAMNIY